MAGWYELSKSSDGQFRFVLKDGFLPVSAGTGALNTHLAERVMSHIRL